MPGHQPPGESLVLQHGRGAFSLKYFVVANPIAGNGRVGREVNSIRRTMAQCGLEHEIVFTRAPGHATELAGEAARDGWDVVVAAGGDGTMGEVVNGIAGTGRALGLLPLGTGNDLARTFGIPLTLDGAVRVLANPLIRCIDLGVDTGTCFAIITSLGFPSDVMYYVNTHHGRLSGQAKIVSAIVSLLPSLRAHAMRVTLDDRVVEGKYVGIFVLNTCYTGGGLKMSPEASTEDGLLDVVLIGELSRLSLMTTVPKAYSGRHLSHPAVSLYRSRQVRVDTAEPLRKMLDGNVPGLESPIIASVRERALPLVVPS